VFVLEIEGILFPLFLKVDYIFRLNCNKAAENSSKKTLTKVWSEAKIFICFLFNTLFFLVFN